jgi:hypothetical protein
MGDLGEAEQSIVPNSGNGGLGTVEKRLCLARSVSLTTRPSQIYLYLCEKCRSTYHKVLTSQESFVSPTRAWVVGGAYQEYRHRR